MLVHGILSQMQYAVAEAAPSAIVATGGTITTVGDYTVHTFTTSDTFEITAGSGEVEYLVIGGGGGGGWNTGANSSTQFGFGGGGGAGGYRSSVAGESSGGGSAAETPLTLGPGSYTVTVGAGGAGQSSDRTVNGANGQDSVFDTITAVGGGGGGSSNNAGSNPNDGSVGGSGGGGGSLYRQDSTGGAGTANQGYAGGIGGNDTTDESGASGGGGGGAGEVGMNFNDNGETRYSPGDGGDGVQSSIDGTPTFRAGGGGGAAYGTSGINLGLGGAGGGGNGGLNSPLRNGADGTANTGGGGGAGGDRLSGDVSAGDGGSGIVIVRYLTGDAPETEFVPSYTPYAYYDGLNTTNSVDSVNKTWSDIAGVNTTDDSTFDTETNSGGLPTWNSNGYWEIVSDQGTNQGQAFKYSSATNTTNPFSFITNDSHTIITFVRLRDSDTDNDIVGSGTTSGAILMGGYSSPTKTRAHAWVTSTRTVDSTASVNLDQWYIMGQRLVVNGASSRIDAFNCAVDGTVSITQSSTFSYSSPSYAPNEITIGGRGTSIRGNNDIAAYALYKSALTDQEIQDICDELSTRFGNPT